MKKKALAAQNHDFYILFWIFFCCCVFGVLFEVVLVYLDHGIWMSRAGLLYGPFNPVYGVGAVLLTVFLCKPGQRSNVSIFLGGALLGGGFEYLCSFLQEHIFGTVSWDYSDMPFNFGGRTNLLYCVGWGALALLWVRGAYPLICKFLERRRARPGIIFATVALAVFMIYNVVISGLAVYRQTQRSEGVPATGGIAAYLDRHFPDSRIDAVYASAVRVDDAREAA